MTRPSSLLAVVGLGIAGLVLCGQAHADLINHWKFDEAAGVTTAADSAGSLPLALQGNAAFAYDATRGGQVLSLDGVGDYASNAGEPFTSDTTHTVGVWVNHAGFTGASQRWLSWGGSPGGRYFIGPYSTNGGRVFAGASTWNAFFLDPDSRPVADTWQYWTLVRQGTTATLYVDGDFVETLTVPNVGGAITDAGELRIGRQYGTNTEYLHGLMDDLAIWNEALAPEQIINAMDYGAANYMIPEPSSAALLFAAVLGACALLRPRGSLAG